jgi:hypothetical protein
MKIPGIFISLLCHRVSLRALEKNLCGMYQMDMEPRAIGVCQSSIREESIGFFSSSQADDRLDRGTYLDASLENLQNYQIWMRRRTL